ncbi:MAB_1171c family putative transporter [Streptomyces sp.]|uniref:MAB_1171c family putative transporter n=1 Tax=Streptomyces sp. TaxID=1931 RepID=UPI002D765F2D|nr:MAB_1171c family putative transporter [Streptomyces sp.]HET6353405.1 MAB_1171c family putative transporter [Streptomyces sp.]
MEGLSFYIPGAVMLTAFLLKLPALRRNPDDTLLRSVSGLLLVASFVFLFAAPSTIAAVNRITGIPNFSAPLVYCILTAFSGACLVLIINWRGGPPEQTRRTSRLSIAAYGLVVVALIVLFALGDAPVERLRDLDTYYANTPFIREMIVLYLLAHTVAAVVMTVLCWRWSRRVGRMLQYGLRLIVFGYLLNLGFDGVKFAAMGARWAGGDWDGLSTYVAPPLAQVSALLIGTGFVFPLIGHRISVSWSTAVRYRRLGFLARALNSAASSMSASVTIGRWASLDLRLMKREAAIHDRILALTPYFDHSIHTDTYAAALAQGQTDDHAQSLADAAMIAAASTAQAANPGRNNLAAPESARQPSRTADDLVQMSHAVRRSPLVHEACRRAALTESSTP